MIVLRCGFRCEYKGGTSPGRGLHGDPEPDGFGQIMDQVKSKTRLCIDIVFPQIEVIDLVFTQSRPVIGNR